MHHNTVVATVPDYAVWSPVVSSLYTFAVAHPPYLVVYRVGVCVEGGERSGVKLLWITFVSFVFC